MIPVKEEDDPSGDFMFGTWIDRRELKKKKLRLREYEYCLRWDLCE